METSRPDGQHDVTDGDHETDAPAEIKAVGGGELPLGYIAWLVYSAVLSAKVGLIYGTWLHIAGQLKDDVFFGANLLRTTISLTAVVFYTLVVTHHTAPKNSDRQSFMESVCNGVTFDVLDATEILDVLYTAKSRILLPFDLHRAIVAVTCIDFILPTVLLLAMSQTRFGRKPEWLKRLKFCHKALYYLLINAPLFIIRLVIWHVHKEETSVFVIKNVMYVGIAGQAIFNKVIDIRPAATPDSHEMHTLNAPVGSTSSDQKAVSPI